MMKNKDLIRALGHMKVETGSLVCWGCGYEHSCSVHGCAIINEAIESIQNHENARKIIKDYLIRYRGPIPRKAFIEVMKLTTMGEATHGEAGGKIVTQAAAAAALEPKPGCVTGTGAEPEKGAQK